MAQCGEALLDEAAWRRRLKTRGIVRPSGRDVVRLLTEVRGRAGQPESSEARGVGHGDAIGPGSSEKVAAHERARRSPADRLRVRCRARPEKEPRRAS